MSTQTRNSGGSRNQKKTNSGSGGGGGDSVSQNSHKKTDNSKSEKEKSHPKPTAEQLRIAQITNSNTSEDPQMREKVATLIETTQRSEEEVCCALYECDNNLENAVLFLLETLPVGAFETSSKKKKNKAAAVQDSNAGAGDGDWDGNANTDKREKSRNRNSSNRGGRGGSDSRGWRGREARENDRNTRSGGDREDRTNDNYRGNSRGGFEGRRGAGGGRGGGYVGRGGRGGGRMGGGRGGAGGRSDRNSGGYGSRYSNTNDDHQEVELWDNTIAQNAEKQQQQSQDDTWGDWDNEEYVGSLKDSKVFTTSNLPNQTAASVLTSGLAVSGGAGGNSNTSGILSSDLSSSTPSSDHHQLGTSVIASSSVQTQPQGSHLNSVVGSGVSSAGQDDNSTNNLPSAAAPPLMQYSAAVSSTPQMLQQQSSVGSSSALTPSSGSNSAKLGPQYTSGLNSYSAAINLVQQAEQMKSSTTLSAEQSQYFNSLTSQSAASQAVAVGSGVPQQQQMTATYAQSANSMQYPTSYANVFGSATGSGSSSAMSNDPSAQIQLNQQPQVRRARAKLPPPSKIPSSAVEMPGDSLNNIGYLDVQFGGLDFGTDESFENLSEKFNTSVNLDGQQAQQQQQQQKSLVQSAQEVGVSSYDQAKSATQQQQASNAGMQNSHLADTLTTAGYSQRSASQQQQPQQLGANATQGGVGAGSNALDQLAKNDPYNQQNSTSAPSYQSSYQSNTNISNKNVANAYQPSVSSQGYSNSAYGNVQQSSVANSYQPQPYGSYQQNSMASYQQQQSVNPTAQSTTGTAGSSSVGGGTSSTQNIPSVGGINNTNNAAANTNSSYLSSAYGSQQNTYQSSQSVYGSTGLSNSTGYTGSSNPSSSQYGNFSSSAKLKDTNSTPSNASHYESVSGSSAISNSSSAVNSVSSGVNSNNAVANSMNSSSLDAISNNKNVNTSLANNNSANSSSSTSSSNNATSNVVSQTGGSGVGNVSSNNASSNVNSNNAVSAGVSVGSASASSAVAAVSSGVSAASNKTGSVTGSSGAPAGSSGGSSGGAGSGMVPNIQMVSQYIQTSMPYYQQPVYSYEDLQMMQQRVPHVQGYYDLNYTPTNLGAGRDNLGSVAYSTMTDGRFARTDNNSSPVSNVSSTMSQQAGSSGPMLNVPYAYFYGSNVMPGSFQYGTPAIYPQIPAANTASGGKFPQPSYNTGYGSTNYDALSQAAQDYTKGTYPSSVNQPTKSQNVTNPPQAGNASDITSSMYGKGHVALNKVNSYEKQNFHSGTPPPFNMANTQTAGGTSAQPYGMYLPTMPAAGHHMIHPPIHQMDGRIHNSSRRDSNSTGQRQPASSQSKSATKQGYSPSYWTGQN